MPKIKKRTSTVISLILTVSVMLMLAAVMIALPFVIEDAPMMTLVKDYFDEKTVLGISGTTAFWCWFYLDCVIAEICCAAVVFLLIRVRRKQVFSPLSVAILRFVSWGVILIAFTCFAATVYFNMAVILALVFCFLGLCLRVVKNVLEEATAIKDENDLTV